jgi:hypothetical protein
MTDKYQLLNLQERVRKGEGSGWTKFGGGIGRSKQKMNVGCIINMLVA